MVGNKTHLFFDWLIGNWRPHGETFLTAQTVFTLTNQAYFSFDRRFLQDSTKEYKAN